MTVLYTGGATLSIISDTRSQIHRRQILRSRRDIRLSLQAYATVILSRGRLVQAMNNEQALEVALAAARKLSRPARRILAERLLRDAAAQPKSVLVPLRQFDMATQKHFQEL